MFVPYKERSLCLSRTRSVRMMIMQHRLRSLCERQCEIVGDNAIDFFSMIYKGKIFLNSVVADVAVAVADVVACHCCCLQKLTLRNDLTRILQVYQTCMDVLQ